jgi:hypothetical protein
MVSLSALAQSDFADPTDANALLTEAILSNLMVENSKR